MIEVTVPNGSYKLQLATVGEAKTFLQSLTMAVCEEESREAKEAAEKARDAKTIRPEDIKPGATFYYSGRASRHIVKMRNDETYLLVREDYIEALGELPQTATSLARRMQTSNDYTKTRRED